MLTGRGGWPLTVFMSPDGRPFYAGTYYPPRPRGGMPSFRQVLESIIRGLATRERDEVAEQASKLTALIGRRIPSGENLPDSDRLEQAYGRIRSSFDPVHGGLRESPEIPPAASPGVPGLRPGRALGGRGRFHAGPDPRADGGRRYLRPTGRGVRPLLGGRTLAGPPLREDALRQRHAGQDLPVGGESAWERRPSSGWPSAPSTTCAGTCETPRAASTRPRTPTPRGWRDSSTCGPCPSLTEVAGEADAASVAEWFGVTEQGNFEGANILTRRSALSPTPGAIRAARERPAGGALAEDPSRTRSQDRGGLERTGHPRLRRGRGRPGPPRLPGRGPGGRTVRSRRDARRRTPERLCRVWTAGRRGGPAYLEDLRGGGHRALRPLPVHRRGDLVPGGRPAHRGPSPGCSRIPPAASSPPARTAERLISRPKDLMDNPSPSGNSLAAEALLALGQYTGENRWWSLAEEAVRDGALPGGEGPLGHREPAGGGAGARGRSRGRWRWSGPGPPGGRGRSGPGGGRAWWSPSARKPTFRTGARRHCWPTAGNPARPWPTSAVDSPATPPSTILADLRRALGT